MKLTFKEFILTESSVKNSIKYNKMTRTEELELSSEEIIRYIEQYSPKTIEMLKHTRIYRGASHKITYGPKYVDPTIFNRKSANTSNFYTTLVDNLPSWADYPKRSQSLVGSTNFGYASEYGNVYLIIPMDGVPIGISSEEDFWESFPYVQANLDYESMDIFNTYIYDMLDSLNDIKTLKVKPSILANSLDFKTLKHELNKITKDNFDKIYFTKDTRLGVRKSPFREFIEKNLISMSMIDILDKLLNPEKNKFKLIKSGDKFPENTTNNEVWVGGKLILLPVRNLEVSREVLNYFDLTDKIEKDRKY